jgi:hypothetical protein
MLKEGEGCVPDWQLQTPSYSCKSQLGQLQKPTGAARQKPTGAVANAKRGCRRDFLRCFCTVLNLPTGVVANANRGLQMPTGVVGKYVCYCKTKHKNKTKQQTKIKINTNQKQQIQKPIYFKT